MAPNTPKGSGWKSAVRGRSQVKNPKTAYYIEFDSKIKKFTSVKSDKRPFMGVRKGE